jgi:beta-lactamase regulating signal transducer with metallopeptidase domain
MLALLWHVPGPSVQRALRDVGEAIAHSLWQSTVIAAISAIVLRRMRGAPATARYLLCCAALALMFIVPVATVAARDAGSPLAGSRALHNVEFSAALRISAAVAPAAEPVFVAAATGWLTGIAIVTIYHACGVLRLRRWRNAAYFDDHDLRRLLRRQRRRLGIRQPLQVGISDYVQTPIVIGWLKPVILLPIIAFSELTPQQIEFILAHELAHIRRHDQLVNYIQTIVETLLFYHPAAWWISRQIRIERENCCDDVASQTCGDRRAYCAALSAMEHLRCGEPVPAAALPLTGRAESLLPRIRRLLAPQAVEQSAHSMAVTTMLVLLGCALLFTLTVKPRSASYVQRLDRATIKPANVVAESATLDEAPGSSAPQAPASETQLVTASPRDVLDPRTPPYLREREQLLRASIARMDAQLETLSQRLGPNHPRMIDGYERRQKLEQQLQEVLQQIHHERPIELSRR